MDSKLLLPLKRKALHKLFTALYWSGISELYRRSVNIDGAVILMYHSIATPETACFIDSNVHMTPECFEAQIAFLARHRSVISMSQLVSERQAGRKLPRGSVVITFDDGYLDNLTVAAPILERYQLPATIYIPTEVVDREDNLWVDKLYTMFAFRTVDRFVNAKGKAFDLSDETELLTAYHGLNAHFIECSGDEQREALSEVYEQLKPTHKPPKLMLSWKELKTLKDRFPLFEIGVHGATHTDLTKLSEQKAAEEIKGCCDDMVENLSVEPKHFSFPYNRSTGPLCQILEKQGLCSGVTSGQDVLIEKNANLRCLPRIDALLTSSLFRLMTSGAYPGITQCLLRRQ